MKLGSRLILLREERMLLQKDVASSVGISLRTYQRYEYEERNPDSNTLIALADFFGVNVEYLLGRTGNPHPLLADISRHDLPDNLDNRSLPADLRSLLDRYLSGELQGLSAEHMEKLVEFAKFLKSQA